MDKFSLLSELLESLISWDALGEVIMEGLGGGLELGCLGFIIRFDELEYNMPIRL